MVSGICFFGWDFTDGIFCAMACAIPASGRVQGGVRVIV
jgi:hypothetical protein